MSHVADIVARFGGVRPMAARLDLPPSTVAAWKRRGSIPDRQKQRILSAAEADGVALSIEDFFPRRLAPPDGEAA